MILREKKEMSHEIEPFFLFSRENSIERIGRLKKACQPIIVELRSSFLSMKYVHTACLHSCLPFSPNNLNTYLNIS